MTGNTKLTTLAHVVGAYAKGWSVPIAVAGLLLCFLGHTGEGIGVIAFALYLLQLSGATKLSVGEG